MTYIEYKKGEKHAAKNADESENHESFYDAGYKLTNDDLIIDIDDVSKDVIQNMLTWFDIKTETVWTDRGAHLYFIKPDGFKGANSITALGFPAEYKHSVNTKSVTVKRNGVLRDIENPGYRQELPDILKINRKIKTSLLNMDDGDGRNNALFEHKHKIYHLSNANKVIKFINEFVFATKLDNDELETITRNTKVDTDDMSFDKIAEVIINKHQVRMFNQALFFKGGLAFTNDENMLKRHIHQFLSKKDSRYVDEVYKQLQYLAPIIQQGENDSFEIHFNNGYLHDGKFSNIMSQSFTPYHIPIDYIPDAEPVKEVDDYLEHLSGGEENYEKLILETIAHTLILNKEFKRMLAKFFIYVGGGGNGKGTLLAVIKRILGRHNCSALSIDDMGNESYFVTMQGKLANLGDDVQDSPIDNEKMKMLKNISTCDFVSTRRLYNEATEVEMTLSLIFTSNHVLKSWEKGESYKRRVMWLPIYTKPKTKTNDFITRLTTDEALEYWIRLIIEAYERLYQNQEFTQSEFVDEFNKEYHDENNNILLYFDDFHPEDFLRRKPKDVYEEYESWAIENDLKAQSRKMMYETLEKVMGLKAKPTKIDGVTTRVLTEVTNNDV